MHQLDEVIKKELCNLTANLHVVLLGAEPSPVRVRDRAAIVSSVPDIRVDAAWPDLRGRPGRLTVQGKAGALTLLARSRPVPQTGHDDPLLVQWGVDRRGRRIPICHVDGRTRTIHVLLDLHGASVVDCQDGLEPPALLAEVLFGEPIRALLDRGHEYSVGVEVSQHVHALLKHRLESGQDVLQRELTLLSRLAATDTMLPRAIIGRMELVRRALWAPRRGSKANVVVTAGDVEREIARLGRLVASRACAMLRFAPFVIEGMLNPRFFGRLRIRPLLFRLEGHHVLRLWHPTRGERAPKPALCLGEGAPVLREMEHAGNLYGLVDTVLNFVETNWQGMIDLNGHPRSRSRSDFLSWVF